MKVKVRVTKKHLAQALEVEGMVGRSQSCLLAQAISEQFPEDSVSVSNESAAVGVRTFELPTRASRLVTSFDYAVDRSRKTTIKTLLTKLRNRLPLNFFMEDRNA